MKDLLKIILFLFASAYCGGVYAQENKKDWGRPNWSLSYKFGIADGSTSKYFNNVQIIELKKNFNVAKPISLNLSTSYSYANAKIGSNLNVVSLGGGLSLYPVYVASLIFNKHYDPKVDNIHVDFGFQAILNKADFDYLYTIDAVFYAFKFKKKQSLSPKLSYNIFLSNDETNANPIYEDLKYNALGFYSIGIAYNF